jgi:uncharacterized protein (TIGR03118 family)
VGILAGGVPPGTGVETKAAYATAVDERELDNELYNSRSPTSYRRRCGRLLRHLIEHGQLNAPWGLAVAPPGFGRFGGALLVGKFGNGRINAYDPASGEFLGRLLHQDGRPIQIDGLWALRFGNGVTGDPSTLLFTAGIDDEAHGRFGALQQTS